MKIALIGYGAMGQLVAAKARSAGDDIGVTIRSAEDPVGAVELSQNLLLHDVAIDFSVAGAVLKTAEACARAGVPLVEGTTGWSGQHDQVRRVVEEHDGALVYGANFSIGVNLFYRIVANAASLFKAVAGYAPFIEEAHHARKRDAPSGTALRLRELMAERLSGEIPVSSTRAGYIPGTHRVGFDAVADQIMLTHSARSREGFASGALLAARWIQGRKGIFEFTEVIDELVGRTSDE
jgi:4-hydroxy-tetrahydrodipicolinate reductase